MASTFSLLFIHFVICMFELIQRFSENFSWRLKTLVALSLSLSQQTKKLACFCALFKVAKLFSSANSCIKKMLDVSIYFSLQWLLIILDMFDFGILLLNIYVELGQANLFITVASCFRCGNVNWAKRTKCNICNTNKPGHNEGGVR